MRGYPFCCLFLALQLLLCWEGNGLGGTNLFGIFRKRRMTLLHIQELRERQAIRKGFAGPQGQPLSSEEALELARQDRSFLWKPFGDFFQKMSSTSTPNDPERLKRSKR